MTRYQHVWFVVLEMFLWQSPPGLRTFGDTAERTGDSAVLAANQGPATASSRRARLRRARVLLCPDPVAARVIVTFFLACVIVAGAYGGWTVSRRILFVQAVPALAPLAAIWVQT